jgi:hypothetical protein
LIALVEEMPLHYEVLWTRMKTQKSKRWQDGERPIRFNELFLTNFALGTATFDEQSSVLSVLDEEGKVLGSKVVSCPVVGSEFEFEEFLVTVECANHMDRLTIVDVNPSKIQKHTQQHLSYQDMAIASGHIPESDCNSKFYVAYTRCNLRTIFF